jgi:lysophospholipase L1-like esterase
MIKLLSKELNEALNTDVPRATTLNEATSKPARSSTWTKVPPKKLYNKTGAIYINLIDPRPPTQTTNRYAVLSDHTETSTNNDETIPWKSEVINARTVHRPWQRPPPHNYKTGRKLESDCLSGSRHSQIPTIVNGQVRNCKMSNSNQGTKEDPSDAQSTLKEATRKLLTKKKEYTDTRKHKVLLIGDSHLRGCAANMKLNLSDNFEICGYVNPGAASKSVLKSANNNIKKLTSEDFLIVCCGSNDVNNKILSEVFHEVTNFIQNIKQTNLIFLSIPDRHDYVNSYIHNEINTFNRKLSKLPKIFPHVNVIEVDNTRQLFTAHGFHLNGLGKELLSISILTHIYSALKQITKPVITLTWQDNYLLDCSYTEADHSSLTTTLDNNQFLRTNAVTISDSLNETTEQKNGVIRKSSRPIKAKSIRNNDFLW